MCPECARPFDPENPRSFTRLTRFARWRIWLPSLLLATLLGVVTIVVLATLGFTGAGLWIGVPLALGTLVGYAGHLKILSTICLGITVIGGILVAMLALNLAGVYCSLVLAGIFFGPVLIGAVFGTTLRSYFKATKWFERRGWIVRAIIVATPVVWSLIEGRPGNTLPIETVKTSESIPVSPAAAWNSLMTYEQVQHTPPALLRLGLPKPVRVEGSMRAVGDTAKCVYTDGYLVKEVTERTATTLTFDVVEQTINTHDSITLLDGSFEFTPNATGATVVLTTRYRPHLAPRFVWRRAETLVVRTLHRHVIDGIRADAERNTAGAVADASP